MFKICSLCDFEWHTKDGLECPACQDSIIAENEIEMNEYKGGAFGTGKDSMRLKNWYAAIGIIALILIIYSFLLV